MRSHVASGTATGGADHRVVGILWIRIELRQVRRFAQHHDHALQLAFVLIEVGRFLHVQHHDVASNLAVGAFAPAEGVNADAFLDRAGDLGGFQSARPAVRDLRRFQMRVDAVVLEALQRPVAGRLHLRRP